MANHLRAELVLDAMEMAVGQRRPKDVIHHSDQGSQYTSVAFGKRCGEAGVRPSMGSVGDAYDNAMAESFFSTLEAELLSRRRFASQAEAKMACFTYVRPGQPALCWLVLRPLLRWPDRQQAALAFDHDIAGIGGGRRDQRDPAAAVMDDLVANTLRTAAGLAKAATGQQQPGPPIAFRRLLVGPPPPAPIVLDRFELAVTRPFQERRQLFWRQRCEQFGG
jgi:hypothetical protein